MEPPEDSPDQSPSIEPRFLIAPLDSALQESHKQNLELIQKNAVLSAWINQLQEKVNQLETTLGELVPPPATEE